MTTSRPPKALLPRILVLSGLLGASAVAGAAPADAAPVYRAVTGVTPGHVAWLYRSPDTASRRVGYLKAGSGRVRALSCTHLAKGGWCQVQHLGTRGWVQDRFLAPAKVMRG